MTVSVHRYEFGQWGPGTVSGLPGNITGSDINGIGVQSSVQYLLVETFNPVNGAQWTILEQTGASRFTVMTTCPSYIIQPRGLVACTGDIFYIVERSRGMIFKFTKATGTWDPHGIELPEEVTDPQGIAVDLFGAGYVVDGITNKYYKVTEGVWDSGTNLPARIDPGGIALDTNSTVYVQDIRSGLIYEAEAGTDVWVAGTDSLVASGVKGIAIDIPAPPIDDGRLEIAFTEMSDLSDPTAGVGTGTDLTVGDTGFFGAIADSFNRFIDNLGNVWEKIKGIWTNIGSLGDIFL